MILYSFDNCTNLTFKKYSVNSRNDYVYGVDNKLDTQGCTMASVQAPSGVVTLMIIELVEVLVSFKSTLSWFSWYRASKHYVPILKTVTNSSEIIR